MLDSELLTHFNRARESGAGESASGLTFVEIAAASTHVAFASDERTPQIVHLNIGSNVIGRGTFQHSPPTPLELENAITIVEDEVMPLAKRLPNASMLVGAGEALHEIARAAGHAASVEDVLRIDEVERLFQQLAAVAQGRPLTSSGLPSGTAFAASLLILREFMHHLRFETIRLQS